jgi:hypothetical protein
VRLRVQIGQVKQDRRALSKHLTARKNERRYLAHGIRCFDLFPGGLRGPGRALDDGVWEAQKGQGRFDCDGARRGGAVEREGHVCHRDRGALRPLSLEL